MIAQGLLQKYFQYLFLWYFKVKIMNYQLFGLELILPVFQRFEARKIHQKLAI